MTTFLASITASTAAFIASTCSRLTMQDRSIIEADSLVAHEQVDKSIHWWVEW